VKPPVFDYYDPLTLEEALGVLDQYGDDAKVLAGGQSLMPLLNMRLARPGALVDLNKVSSLNYITVENGTVRVGAMARQRDVEVDPAVARSLPLLVEALHFVGHVQIRLRGTIGGSLAHADPAGELPALLVCLDGEVVAAGHHTAPRTIPARDLFVTYLTTSLRPAEILTEVRFPMPPPGTGSAFEELSRRHGDYALVGVAATVRLASDGSINDARIAFTGCGPIPTRAADAERYLEGGRPVDGLWERAADLAARDLEPDSDLHASGAYRKRVAAVLAARALRKAAARAAPPDRGRQQ